MTPRIWLVAFCMFMLGCDRAARETASPPEAPEVITDEKTRLAKPDVLRMSYDADTRVLNLYDLQDGQKWMLVSPWNPKGEPVGGYHAFMQEVNIDQVTVYYKSANGQSSPRVTLKEIVTQAVSLRK